MVEADRMRKEPELDRTELKIGLAKKLLNRSPTAATSALVFAMLAAALLSIDIPTRDLILWLIAILACAALPFIYIAVQSRYPFSPQNIDRYLFANALSCLCSGLTWGTGMGLLADGASFITVMFTFLIVMGYSTGAVISHGLYLPSYLSAAGTALLIYGLSVISRGDAPGFGFGIAALVVLVPYVLVARHAGRNAVAEITSGWRQQALLGELKAQRDEIDKINKNKSRFLAATSHDLAQPLHAQGNYIAALGNRLSNAEQRELLDR
ncbi:MAG: hypothetical protein MI785_04185, partial [Kiloniellales bacterium]|nr:hypothetical protein [Kiloniellales bacterium]